ncbi:MAG: hypothetical protein FJ299_01570 [Planctomycetes bacterium]|nr:hypothetical protein [Planctomycetota bacterium]
MSEADTPLAALLAEARTSLSRVVEALDHGMPPPAPTTGDFERQMHELKAALGTAGSRASLPRESEALRDLLRVAQQLATRELDHTVSALSGVRAARERLERQRERLHDARNCDLEA